MSRNTEAVQAIHDGEQAVMAEITDVELDTRDDTVRMTAQLPTGESTTETWDVSDFVAAVGRHQAHDAENLLGEQVKVEDGEFVFPGASEEREIPVVSLLAEQLALAANDLNPFIEREQSTPNAKAEQDSEDGVEDDIKAAKMAYVKGEIGEAEMENRIEQALEGTWEDDPLLTPVAPDVYVAETT